MRYLLPLLLLVGLAGCVDYDDYAYQPPPSTYSYGYGYSPSYYAPSYYAPSYYGAGNCGAVFDWNSCWASGG